MNLRPFGATGDVPGTITPFPRSLPILPVPAVPGGTLMNPVDLPGTGARGVSPMSAGGSSIVSRESVLQVGAQVSRGTGPAGTRTSEALVHAGTRTPGVHSNGPMVRALAGIDRRNPVIAPYALRARMVAGATRIG